MKKKLLLKLLVIVCFLGFQTTEAQIFKKEKQGY